MGISCNSLFNKKEISFFDKLVGKVFIKLEFGNISAAKEITVKDVIAQAVNKVTENSTAVLGTAEINAVITVESGTKELERATVDANGKYAVTIKKQKIGTGLSVFATD